MTFHEQLTRLRKQRGLSQEQLGAEIGVSRQAVSKWESGDTTPEMEKLILLSDFFDLPVDVLIGREAPRRPAPGPEVFLPGGWHYEYKSKRTLLGLPLVHVNIGRGLYRAKGVIAIGVLSRGVVSIGGASAGVLSLGSASAGVLSLGAFSFGLILSLGGISVGGVAIGGLAAGVLAVGGCAFGVYSLGGVAVAAKIAAGGVAHAPIAIGDRVKGGTVFSLRDSILPQEIRAAILKRFPHTWTWLVELFASLS